MNTTSEPATDSAAMTDLVERCRKLCEKAEVAIGEVTNDRNSFLGHSLEGALQQLELILRVASEEGSPDGPREEERQGFLRRLFARSEAEGAAPIGDAEGEGADLTPPTFDVSRHGLQGNSWTISLAELLGFLAFGRKTGVLWVDAPSENFLVGLVDGNLRHATSDCTPEGLRLGEILVGLGFLTRRQLERFLVQHGGEAPLSAGELLLQSGMISDDELHAALVYQVRQLVFRLVGTTNAVFRFREHMEISLPFQVNLDVNQLLLESAQASDEVDNAAERATAVMRDWNNWRKELSSEVGPTAPETAEGETSTSTSDTGTGTGTGNTDATGNKPKRTPSETLPKVVKRNGRNKGAAAQKKGKENGKEDGGSSQPAAPLPDTAQADEDKAASSKANGKNEKSA